MNADEQEYYSQIIERLTGASSTHFERSLAREAAACITKLRADVAELESHDDRIIRGVRPLPGMD